MIILKILLALICILAVLLLAALAHTLTVKPTTAVTAKPTATDPDRAKAYADKLAKLIQKETVSTKGETDFTKFHEFQALCAEEFPTLFQTCEVSRVGEGLVLRYPAAGAPKGKPILLMSHHDVVAADAKEWKHPPFSGHIDENGHLWGRGTVDTKGSLFCEMAALEELIKEGWKPDVDVYITSSCTEEWSGPSAKEIVKWLKERNVRIGMLMDEGGIVLEEPMAGVQGHYCKVGVVEKGYGDVKFTAKGHGGHASTPAKGSPLPRLGAFMDDVDKHSPFRMEFSPALKEMFARLAPNMNFGMKYLFTNLWLFAPLLKRVLPAVSPEGAAMMRTTCAFTTCKGADGLNILPAEAYVTANMRFIMHQAGDESIELMRQRAKKYDIETEILTLDQPSSTTSHSGGAFDLIEKTAAKVFPGYDVVPYIMMAGTDARFYDEICDNTLRFAPLEIDKQQYGSIHTRDENLTIDRLPLAVDFYKEILRGYAEKPIV